MRGRPARELLRQSAPLIAVAAALVAAPAAAGGSPQPDRPPAAATALAPDPVPGTAPPAASPRVTAPVAVTPVQPVEPVQPAKPATLVNTKPKVKHVVVEPRPRRAAPARPARFRLPRVALPALIAVDPVRSPHDRDAVLAGVALLLAAFTAASGARLVAVWNRRAGPA